MNARTVLIAALLAPALTALPAHAAKPLCLQVTDPTGDGKTADGTTHGPLDIVSGDIATGKRNLVAVVRLKSLAADPALAGGVVYTFVWGVTGVGQSVTLTVFSDGSHAATFDPNTAAAASNDSLDVPVVVDPATSTVTWTVPRSADPALRKSGVRLGGFALAAVGAVNAALPAPVSFEFSFSGDTLGRDSAASGRTYLDKTPTCVKGV